MSETERQAKERAKREAENARRLQVIRDHVLGPHMQQDNHALVTLECYRCFGEIEPGHRLTEGYDPTTGKAFYVCWPCVEAVRAEEDAQ